MLISNSNESALAQRSRAPSRSRMIQLSFAGSISRIVAAAAMENAPRTTTACMSLMRSPTTARRRCVKTVSGRSITGRIQQWGKDTCDGCEQEREDGILDVDG